MTTTGVLVSSLLLAGLLARILACLLGGAPPWAAALGLPLGYVPAICSPEPRIADRSER